MSTTGYQGDLDMTASETEGQSTSAFGVGANIMTLMTLKGELNDKIIKCKEIDLEMAQINSLKKMVKNMAYHIETLEQEKYAKIEICSESIYTIKEKIKKSEAETREKNNALNRELSHLKEEIDRLEEQVQIGEQENERFPNTSIDTTDEENEFESLNMPKSKQDSTMKRSNEKTRYGSQRKELEWMSEDKRSQQFERTEKFNNKIKVENESDYSTSSAFEINVRNKQNTQHHAEMEMEGDNSIISGLTNDTAILERSNFTYSTQNMSTYDIQEPESD